MRVGPSVDQLRIHSHLIADTAAHCLQEGERHRAASRSRASCGVAGLVLHHARATDHFQVRDLRQVRQNFVLHAVGKISVLFVFAQVFKRQNRDALFRN